MSQFEGQDGLSGDDRVSDLPMQTDMVEEAGSFGDASLSAGEQLIDLYTEHRLEDQYQRLHWQGTFAEYLTKVTERPEITRHAPKRLYDMVLSHGYDVQEEMGREVKRYKFFEDPFSGGANAIYGLDEELQVFVDRLQAAANGLGVEKRIILLKGPVGSAKSTLAALLKRGLEAYSREEEGEMYTFGWREDLSSEDSSVHWTQMNEDPLNLIPREMLPHFLERFNASEDTYQVVAPKGLSAESRAYFNDYMERYDGDWSKVLNHVVVKRLIVSEENRVGIGTFQPKDPKDQDSTELSGDINYRKIAEIGKDSDPRAFNFDGELCVANRGFVEFIELIKLDTAFLYDLLGASQEQQIKPKKFALTPIDTVIIGHTNEPEWKRLVNNPRMEAFVDRTVVVPIPYNLQVSEEARIYEKNFTEKKIGGHIAPHSLEVAAMFAVLSRLAEDEKGGLSLVHKMKLYDGEAIAGVSEDRIRQLQELGQEASDDSHPEGFDGISFRYIEDRIGRCITESDLEDGIDPFKVMDSLRDGLRGHARYGVPEERTRLEAILGFVEDEYKEIVKREVEEAMSGDKEALARLLTNYLDNVNAYISREKIKNQLTDRMEAPDEHLMRSIEDEISIAETHKDDFRREIMGWVGSNSRKNKEFSPDSHPRLREALRKHLFKVNRDSYRLPVNLSGADIDPETRDKIDTVKRRLKEQFGYNEQSAKRVLQYVSSVFARGESDKKDSDS